MKSTEKKKPIKTLPDGIWESSSPEPNENKNNITTDLQGNGYPLPTTEKQSK